MATLTVAPQVSSTEAWTGGFFIDGRWHAVNLRLDLAKSSGTADYISPFFGGAENAINVPLVIRKPDRGNLQFELATARGNIVFTGRQTGETITGEFVYGEDRGSFGVTHLWNTRLDILESYYGAYQVAPDHVISILRGWGYARTLNFVDYKTGKVGTLWPSSANDFYSGDGLAVSFPVGLKVSFRSNTLEWQSKNGPKRSASRIEFKEESFNFKNGDSRIGATLILPAAPGPHPAIIVTPGDYGTNRNQLRLWAHHYVSNGIAALIFDSRGAGGSDGPVNSSSFSDLANDVLAGVAALKSRPDINRKKIGLFGFSNSAFTVSLAASRSNDVAFLILQSLVGVVPWKQESYRAETQLRVDGFPDADLKKGAGLMRTKYEVARTGTGWDQLQKMIEDARGERWLAYTSPPNNFDRLRNVYQTTMIYDPVPALEKLRMPVLAIWGAKDTYLPVEESVRIFRQAMKKAGNKDSVVKVLPNANHSLIISGDGSPSTGGTEQAYSPGLWKMKIDWLSKVLR